jgi:hypothetical protein
MKRVYSTGSLQEAELLRVFLRQNGIESMLENDQDQFHCLNYWRIFETIIPPAGVTAGRNVSTERGN